MKAALDALIRYGLDKGLIHPGDETYVFNRLLEILRLDEAEESGTAAPESLADILTVLTDDAVRRGLVDDNITARDLFDTALMGALTPWPHEVRERFAALYADSPRAATVSQRISSGFMRATTALSTSPSIYPNPRKIRAPLLPRGSHRRPVIPNACSAPRTRAMPDA